MNVGKVILLMIFGIGITIFSIAFYFMLSFNLGPLSLIHRFAVVTSILSLIFSIIILFGMIILMLTK